LDVLPSLAIAIFPQNRQRFTCGVGSGEAGVTKDELHEAAMALPGATMDVKWGADYVYSVGGKMFCATDADFSNLSFKATDIAFEALTQTGRATPNKYLARAKWVSLDDLASADAAEVADWVRTAHGLVASGLSKKLQKELGVA
jgi:predicted DNA-binding protein (MmcQ/YjbR family)